MDIKTTNTEIAAQQLNEKVVQVGQAAKATSKPKVRKLSIEAAYEDTQQIVAVDRDEYVRQFRKQEQATAAAILDMARVVYEAHQALDEGDFDHFCNQVGYSANSSSIRKFLAIGKVQPRMKAYADQLPTGWTSIYQLTQIPAETFEKMVANGQSLATLTGTDVRELVKSTRPIDSFTGHLKKERTTGNLVFATVCFVRKEIDRADWLMVKNAFAGLESRFPIKFVVNAEGENIYDQANLAAYDKRKVDFVKRTNETENLDNGRYKSSNMPAVITTSIVDPASAN